MLFAAFIDIFFFAAISLFRCCRFRCLLRRFSPAVCFSPLFATLQPDFFFVVLTPLPLYFIISSPLMPFFTTLFSGCCQVLPLRFSFSSDARARFMSCF